MYDTCITVVGNVCTKPIQRQFPTGSMTDFKVASTSRRFDKELGKWVDGDELFIRVACWRALAQHVYKSVRVGDPVIIRGRLYSRRYTDKDEVPRTAFEISAQAIGHDLSRGVGQFSRVQSSTNTPLGGGETGSTAFDAIVESIDLSAESDAEREPALSA